jgi:hypothetical protein
MSRISVAVFAFLPLALIFQPCWAQTEAETQARVPELEKLHEVIYPLWHNAFPNKDTALIRQLWPDIQKDIAALDKAELPGILRDKKEAWQRGLEAMKAAEKAYGEALGKGAQEDKLKAAEELHRAYEGLVWTIRPMLPELARFHESLYKMYHYYLPNKDAQAFKEALPMLQARMDTLNKAALPKRLTGKQGEFDKARAVLSEKVQKVLQNQPCCTWSYTEGAVEGLHSAYQAVEKIFN